MDKTSVDIALKSGMKVIRKVTGNNVISIDELSPNGFIIYTDDGEGVIAHRDFLESFIKIS